MFIEFTDHQWVISQWSMSSLMVLYLQKWVMLIQPVFNEVVGRAVFYTEQCGPVMLSINQSIS